MSKQPIDSRYLIIGGIGVAVILILSAIIIFDLASPNARSSKELSGGLLPVINYDDFQQSRLIVHLPGGDGEDDRTFVETWFGTSDCPKLRVRYIVESFGNVNETTSSGSYIKARQVHAYWHDEDGNCTIDQGEILTEDFEIADEAYWSTYEQP